MDEIIQTYTRALQKSDLSTTESEAENLVTSLWPDILEIGTDDAGFTEYEITISPLANLLSAVMCGDHNAAFHTNDGYLQTLAIIGICSAITSHFCPGFVLARIEPDVSFKTAIPIGSTVNMFVRESKVRGDIRWLTMKGWVNESNNALFSKDRTLVMRKI